MDPETLDFQESEEQRLMLQCKFCEESYSNVSIFNEHMEMQSALGRDESPFPDLSDGIGTNTNNQIKTQNHV